MTTARKALVLNLVLVVALATVFLGVARARELLPENLSLSRAAYQDQAQGATSGDLAALQLSATRQITENLFIYLPIALYSRPYVAPVLANGGFEAGPGVGWQEYSSHGWPLIVDSTYLSGQASVLPHSGNWAAWLGGDNLETSWISQQITVPSANARLSYWRWIDSADPDGGDNARIMVNATVVEQLALSSGTSTGQWVQRTLDLTAWAGRTVPLVIEVQTDGEFNSNFFVDDFVLGSPLRLGAGDRDSRIVPGSRPVAPTKE
jgi:hypothetical protein